MALGGPFVEIGRCLDLLLCHLQFAASRRRAHALRVSRGFKICLWILGAYCLLMAPLIWQGLLDGNATMNGAPTYIGLLSGLLIRYRSKRAP
jgi:hypothetical protein